MSVLPRMARSTFTSPASAPSRTGGRVLVQMNGLGLGGSEVTAVQFAAAVRAHGYESILVAPSDTLPAGPSIHQVAAEYGVRVSTFERPSSAFRAARVLTRLAQDARADIVHVYGQGAIRGAYLGPARLARRPLVHTAYEMAVDPHTFTGTELIVGTRYLREDLADRRGPTTLISPPVDLDRDAATDDEGARFRSRWSIRPDDIAIVWVGRLDQAMKARAVETLIDAVGLVRDDRVRLVVVGSGAVEAQLRSRGAEVNAGLGRDAVVFTGALADPRPAYAATDVSVGMGQSAARALAFSRPLVVVGETGWAETFTPGTADALFRNSFWSADEAPAAAEVLASRLGDLVGDPVGRRSLGDFGRRFAEREFGLAAMGARLADVYDRARSTYTTRMWLHDLPREGRAVVHLAGRLTGRRTDSSHGEYRYPA